MMKHFIDTKIGMLMQPTSVSLPDIVGNAFVDVDASNYEFNQN